jgi:hypothetical protein
MTAQWDYGDDKKEGKEQRDSFVKVLFESFGIISLANGNHMAESINHET